MVIERNDEEFKSDDEIKIHVIFSLSMKLLLYCSNQVITLKA